MFEIGEIQDSFMLRVYAKEMENFISSKKQELKFHELLEQVSFNPENKKTCSLCKNEVTAFKR